MPLSERLRQSFRLCPRKREAQKLWILILFLLYRFITWFLRSESCQEFCCMLGVQESEAFLRGAGLTLTSPKRLWYRSLLWSGTILVLLHSRVDLCVPMSIFSLLITPDWLTHSHNYPKTCFAGIVTDLNPSVTFPQVLLSNCGWILLPQQLFWFCHLLSSTRSAFSSQIPESHKN